VDGTLSIRKRILKLLTEGLKSYPQVLKELSGEISTEEAEEAERASRRNLRLLAAASALGFFVQLLIYHVPKDFQGFLHDLLVAGSVVVPLVLVSAFRIHFAGRLLFPLAALSPPRALILDRLSGSSTISG
jgi:hypothetical protein